MAKEEPIEKPAVIDSSATKDTLTNNPTSIDSVIENSTEQEIIEVMGVLAK
mgnify:CR=1 FL=1